MTLMFPQDFSFPNQTPTIPLSIYVRIWLQNREPFLFFVLTIFPSIHIKDNTYY